MVVTEVPATAETGVCAGAHRARRRHAPCRRRTGRCRSRIWCRSASDARAAPTAAACRRPPPSTSLRAPLTVIVNATIRRLPGLPSCLLAAIIAETGGGVSAPLRERACRARFHGVGARISGELSAHSPHLVTHPEVRAIARRLECRPMLPGKLTPFNGSNPASDSRAGDPTPSTHLSSWGCPVMTVSISPLTISVAQSRLGQQLGEAARQRHDHRTACAAAAGHRDWCRRANHIDRSGFASGYIHAARCHLRRGLHDGDRGLRRGGGVFRLRLQRARTRSSWRSPRSPRSRSTTPYRPG